MKIYQTVLPVTLVILVAICSISYFITNHIRSLRRLNENASKFKGIEREEFLDLNDKEAMENVAKKIRHYESIERGPVAHLGLQDLLAEEKDLRKLEASNNFDDVGIVEPSSIYTGGLGYWILHYIKQFEPAIIAYPYAFDYSYIVNETTQAKVTKHYTQGAYISLDPSTVTTLSPNDPRTSVGHLIFFNSS